MIKLKEITLHPDDSRWGNKVVKVNTEGGCGLPECNCSPNPFIVINDGETVWSIEMTDEEMLSLLAGNDLVPEVVS